MSTAVVKLEEVNAVLGCLCGDCRERIESLKVFRVEVGPETTKEKAGIDSLAAMRRTVAAQSGITEEMLLSPSKSVRFVAVRRRFVKRARARGYSLNEIARAVHRDRSSVLNLLRASR